jgi:hypothetical protein
LRFLSSWPWQLSLNSCEEAGNIHQVNAECILFCYSRRNELKPEGLNSGEESTNGKDFLSEPTIMAVSYSATCHHFSFSPITTKFKGAKSH